MHISCNVRVGAEMISIKLFYISKAALYFHSHLEHEDFPLVLMERCWLMVSFNVDVDSAHCGVFVSES